jgi:hypothetical protein
MNVNALIDAMVRQTTVLIAHLATASGVRAPLAHVANQVFLDLVHELRVQGVGGKVIADMFGMALRTYQARVRRLTESATDRGRTLWEVVLGYIQEQEVAKRAEILHRFRYDDDATVKGVLNDLMESGLVFKAGRGDRTIYRAADPAEADEPEPAQGDAALVLVAINRLGEALRSDLAEATRLDEDSLDAALARLLADGRAVEDDDALWRCDECVIPFGTDVGWGAAIFDHYQAVVTALCTKLRAGATQARLADAVGGSTYGFDVWPGHPDEETVLGLLKRQRAEVGALRARVEAHNKDHGAPPGQAQRVIFYMGQTVLEDEERRHGGGAA